MPLSEERRQELMRRADLTDEQIRETVGGFTLSASARSLSGLSDGDIDAAANEIAAMTQDCVVMSAAYNALGASIDGDAREAADERELESDKQVLEESFAEDYTFTDPNGNSGGRGKTLDAIFSGKIRKESFGRGGFETVSEEFRIIGDTAVSSGVFRMRATQLARNTRTGRTQRRRRDGTFKTTHTYIKRDGRWQLSATQLTEVPADRGEWVFVDD